MSVLLLLSDGSETQGPLRLNCDDRVPDAEGEEDGVAIRIPRDCDRVILMVRDKFDRAPIHRAPFVEMPDHTAIMPYSPEVRGSVCVALLAAGEIGDEELVMIDLSAPQPADHSQFLNRMHSTDSDAAVGMFPSHDPRWSYLRVNDRSMVVEACPPSIVTEHALGGIYCFRNGADWVAAAKDVIRKDRHDSGHFQISATVNELILMGRKVAALPLSESTIDLRAAG